MHCACRTERPIPKLFGMNTCTVTPLLSSSLAIPHSQTHLDPHFYYRLTAGPAISFTLSLALHITIHSHHDSDLNVTALILHCNSRQNQASFKLGLTGELQLTKALF